MLHILCALPSSVVTYVFILIDIDLLQNIPLTRFLLKRSVTINFSVVVVHFRIALKLAWFVGFVCPAYCPAYWLCVAPEDVSFQN